MKQIAPIIATLVLVCACDGKVEKDPVEFSDEKEFFDKNYSISGEDYEKAASQTLMRALELCYSTQMIRIEYQGKVVYFSGPSAVDEDFVDDFYSTLQQLAYSPEMTTRGLWSIGKSSIDWYKALNNTEKLYRCAIVGAVTENFDKDQMVELYNQIMKHKTTIFRDWGGLKYVSADFEAEHFSSAGRFWYHFSRGNLDSYARKIYGVIFTPQHLADCFVMTDPIHELAFQLAANDLSPNRLMLSAAGPLIEAGFNTVFGADDIAGYAKLGYDILNDNTQLIIDLSQGKLNTKNLMTAVNTNLGLLTTCIDKIISFDDITGIKDTQDLGSLITSYCVEKGLDVTVTLKGLNNAISETLTDMGKWKLKVNDIAYEYFKKSVKAILGIDEGLQPDGDYQSKSLEFKVLSFNKKSNELIFTWSDKYAGMSMLFGSYTISGNKITITVSHVSTSFSFIPLDVFPQTIDGTIKVTKDAIVLTWSWSYVDSFGPVVVFSADSELFTT